MGLPLDMMARVFLLQCFFSVVMFTIELAWNGDAMDDNDDDNDGNDEGDGDDES